MSAPIALMVRRYQCPHCPHRRAKKATIVEHIGRCWHNPDARGCLTCRHYEPGTASEPEVGWPGTPPSCDRGVSLDGRPVCPECNGYGTTFDGKTLGAMECGSCAGDGAEVKPGPVVHCHEWEAKP